MFCKFVLCILFSLGIFKSLPIYIYNLSQLLQAMSVWGTINYILEIADFIKNGKKILAVSLWLHYMVKWEWEMNVESGASIQQKNIKMQPKCVFQLSWLSWSVLPGRRPGTQCQKTRLTCYSNWIPSWKAFTSILKVESLSLLFISFYQLWKKMLKYCFILEYIYNSPNNEIVLSNSHNV